MIEKKITAKVDQVIKTGSIEEDQVKQIHKLEVLFPEQPEVVKEEPQKVEEPEKQ
jgi:hypothetical protein